MNRIFESWWWTTITVVAFIAWGALTPSHAREQPGLATVSYAALALSVVMCLLTLGSWIRRVRH